MQKKLFSLCIVVAITVTLLISQVFVMHMHSTVHHHDDITAHQSLTDLEEEHRHISQAHSSFDTHINDVNEFSPVEIEVSKEGLSKSYQQLIIFLTSFILILLLTPFVALRVATIIPTKKDLPDKYQLTPELRAPPV